MRIDQRDLNWMCNAARVPECWRRAMVLRYAEELPDVVIAAQLGLAESSVRAYCADAWKAIFAWEREVRRREAGDPDAAADPDAQEPPTAGELLQQRLARQSPRAESDEQHARVILEAIRGHAPSAPPTPVYDSVGRKANNHDPLLDLDDVLDIVQGKEPALYGTEPWARPCASWDR